MAKVLYYYVTEFWGDGDPMFGGKADDRPLGKSGRFRRGSYSWRDDPIAHFDRYSDALRAGEAAPNRREGGIVGVVPVRDWSNA